MNSIITFANQTGNLIYLLAPFVLMGPIFLALALGLSAKPAWWTWAPALLGPVLLGVRHTSKDLELIAASAKTVDPGLREELVRRATEAADLGVSSGAWVSLSLGLFALLVLGLKLIFGAKDREARQRVRGVLAALVLATPGLVILTGGGAPRWIAGAVLLLPSLAAAAAALRVGAERRSLVFAAIAAALPLLAFTQV